jgi:hypothetical protein
MHEVWKKKIRLIERIGGRALFWIGFIAIVCSLVLIHFNLKILSFDGATIITTGIALIAIGITLKTDALVSSLADLNFYEKIAAMAGYVLQLSKITDRSITINMLCIVRHDMKAMACLEEHISPEQINEFKNVILQSLKPYLDIRERFSKDPVELDHVKEIKKIIVQICKEDVFKT